MTVTELCEKYTIDRIGLAYCNMNAFNWDEEIFGPPPERWNKLTDYEKHKNPEFRDCFKLIDAVLPERLKSMYWWTIELNRPYKVWEEWYESRLHNHMAISWLNKKEEAK